MEDYTMEQVVLQKVDTHEQCNEMWFWAKWPLILIVAKGESTANMATVIIDRVDEELGRHEGMCILFLDFVDIEKFAGVEEALPLTQHLKKNKNRFHHINLGIQSSLMGAVAGAGASLAGVDLNLLSSRFELASIASQYIKGKMKVNL